jgi:hypothetical protein
VSITNNGRFLKFAYVARHDGGLAFAEPEPSTRYTNTSTRYTITCCTLLTVDSSDGMRWQEDYTVTSDDLPAPYHSCIPMFPQIDINKPHLVHSLFVKFFEFGSARENMWVLSIDMKTKTVVSCRLYLDENDETSKDKYFILDKRLSPTPTPFLPCEFPRFKSRYVILLLPSY